MRQSSSGSGQNVVVIQPGTEQSPTAIWRAFKAERDELGNQLDRLEDQRRSLVREIQNGAEGVNKSGLEMRIGEIDKRITELEKQIAASDANVAKSAAVPGAVVIPRPPQREGPPEEVFVLGGIFMVVCLLPISIAFARRLWRRGSQAVTALPTELMERINRLDQAVDSIAVEVERIGEGQRFVTRLLSESGRALGAGAAQPIDAHARDKAAINREGR
jgi:hypothetical protein